MVATLPEVWVDGRPLTSFATGWGELKITDRWPMGNWECSWTVPVRTLRRHQALTAGRPVVVKYGGSLRWSGFLSEPNWDTGEMVALGNVRRGEQAICFDSGGLSSTVPDTFIDAAITRGAVPWVRYGSISPDPIAATSTSDNLNYLNDALNAWAAAAGKSWGVNARNEVYALAPPTVATLSVMPDSGVLGVADQALAGAVYGRYQTAGGALATAVAGTGTPEVGLSFLDRGPMDATKAGGIAAGILAKLGARSGWTNGLVLAAQQITNRGGAGVNLASVVADGRNMVSLLGVRDQRGLSAATTFVVGETIWDVPDRTVQVNPMGLIDRSLAGIAEDAGVVVA